MARTPRPDGWKGGSDDFTFVRTLDGHRTVNAFAPPEVALDGDFARNERTIDDAFLGGAYES